MNSEDQREAVKLFATLSGQLMAAGMAILALGGGLTAFVLANRVVGWTFWLAAGSTFASFAVSVFLGGRGVMGAASFGARGDWRLAAGGSYFNWQAIACLMGLLSFVAAATLAGTPKDADVSRRVDRLVQQVARLEGDEYSEELTRELKSVTTRLAELVEAVNSVSRAVERPSKTHRAPVPEAPRGK